MAARDDFAPVDWQGNPVECAACAHRDRLAAGRCAPRSACVHDRYAKRVDRFFKWNPELANDYLDHPYFEVRAIAARHADVFRLPRLLRDPDGTVRFSAMARLPVSQLRELMHDPDREVRVRVALRVEEADLLQMAHDTDYYVRKIVAKRLPVARLAQFEKDPDREVRAVVAQRHALGGLMRMAHDPEGEVRAIVARRLPVALLGQFAQDPVWQVRYAAAERMPLGQLDAFAADEDPMVRELVALRRGSTPLHAPLEHAPAEAGLPVAPDVVALAAEMEAAAQPAGTDGDAAGGARSAVVTPLRRPDAGSRSLEKQP